MPQPNIIYILADDMGYGDMGCNVPACRIPTPNLDRLAGRGMRFTNAHAASSLCTPSRYSVLTGRYSWRSRLKRGIVWPWDAPLIEEDCPTVAGFLRDRGYRTACLGKWHLGWDWSTRTGRHPNETLPFGINNKDWNLRRCEFAGEIDFSQRIAGGPVDRGFDSYFGVDVPNFPPYAWFENDRLTALPTEPKPEDMYGHPGPAVPDWSLEAMIPEFTRRAVEMIENHAADESPNRPPLMLYFALTSPHSPVVPNAPFQGRSGIGGYGDFVCEVDWVVGQVADALDRTGLAENTLLVFTSDNGPEQSTRDDEGCYERARRTQHYSMGPLRGMKRDIWEGGHRVPFVASWPGVVPADTVCEQTIGLLDFFATCAEIVDAPLPEEGATDSVSFWPMLQGRVDQPIRRELVHHSGQGQFALRRGPWVLIDHPTGGENLEPDWFRAERGYEPHDQPGELFNLDDDLPERVNRYAEQPERVAEMTARLREIQGEDAGPAAPEDPGPITA